MTSSSQVGGTRQRQQRSDHERGACRALAELALPSRWAFVWLCRFTRLSTLLEALVASRVQNECDRQGNRSSCRRLDLDQRGCLISRGCKR
jgi:hypothetical protein